MTDHIRLRPFGLSPEPLDWAASAVKEPLPSQLVFQPNHLFFFSIRRCKPSHCRSVFLPWGGPSYCGIQVAVVGRLIGEERCACLSAGATSVGPNLTGLHGNPTPFSIARTMWNHGPAMLQRMERSAISWPFFSGKELADTLAFLKSIEAHSSQGSASNAAGSAP